MKRPNTRLKWKRTREDGNIDYFAKVRVSKKIFYDLSIELSPKGSKTEVSRVIWAGVADPPIFEDVKVHDGDIEYFSKELRGLEWNLLGELNGYLGAAVEKVHSLMYESDIQPP